MVPHPPQSNQNPPVIHNAMKFISKNCDIVLFSAARSATFGNPQRTISAMMLSAARSSEECVMQVGLCKVLPRQKK